MGCPAAHADGIDITTWVMRLPPASGLAPMLGLIALLLVIDYALNFLVVGWLASVSRRHRTRPCELHTLGSTRRPCRRAARHPSRDVRRWAPKESSSVGSSVLWLLVAQFAIAGIAVGLVTWWFARRRWALATIFILRLV